MKNDRARAQIGRISRFGLLELSRQRLRSNQAVRTKSLAHVAVAKAPFAVLNHWLHYHHMIQEQAAKEKEHLKFQIQLPVDVATYLMNEKRKIIESIEHNHPIEVVIIPNVHLQTPHYLLKQVRKNELTSKGKSHVREPVSYKQVKVVKEDNGIKNQMRLAKTDEPAITEFLRDAPLSDMPKRKKVGLIRRILKALFGGAQANPLKRKTRKVNVITHRMAVVTKTTVIPVVLIAIAMSVVDMVTKAIVMIKAVIAVAVGGADVADEVVIATDASRTASKVGKKIVGGITVVANKVNKATVDEITVVVNKVDKTTADEITVVANKVSKAINAAMIVAVNEMSNTTNAMMIAVDVGAVVDVITMAIKEMRIASMNKHR